MDFCIYYTSVFLSLTVQNLVVGICNSPLSYHLAESLSSQILSLGQENNLRKHLRCSFLVPRKINWGRVKHIPTCKIFLTFMALVWSGLSCWVDTKRYLEWWSECYDVVFASFVLIAMRPKNLKNKFQNLAGLLGFVFKKAIPCSVLFLSNNHIFILFLFFARTNF